MERFKNWLIVHCAKTFKAITAAMLLGTVALMVLDMVHDSEVLPDYFQFTNYDWWLWVIILTSIGTANIVMLFFVDCYKCRVFADLLLQVSGVLLLIIGWAFISQYPPLNSLMVVYPVWGIAMIVAGRHMGKRTRGILKEIRNGKTK